MRIENPNYYGIAVIFNYHSSESSMYKILLLHVVWYIIIEDSMYNEYISSILTSDSVKKYHDIMVSLRKF
jgi:CO dehydrogenase/acetyl-CoA synthase gamma subunit (corrinoid Fe-S protein)